MWCNLANICYNNETHDIAWKKYERFDNCEKVGLWKDANYPSWNIKFGYHLLKTFASVKKNAENVHFWFYKKLIV